MAVCGLDHRRLEVRIRSAPVSLKKGANGAILLRDSCLKVEKYQLGATYFVPTVFIDDTGNDQGVFWQSNSRGLGTNLGANAHIHRSGRRNSEIVAKRLVPQ